jgi:hypothetical protein
VHTTCLWLNQVEWHTYSNLVSKRKLHGCVWYLKSKYFQLVWKRFCVFKSIYDQTNTLDSTARFQFNKINLTTAFVTGYRFYGILNIQLSNLSHRTELVTIHFSVLIYSIDTWEAKYIQTLIKLLILNTLNWLLFLILLLLFSNIEFYDIDYVSQFLHIRVAQKNSQHNKQLSPASNS